MDFALLLLDHECKLNIIKSSLESPMGKNPYFAGVIVHVENGMILQI